MNQTYETVPNIISLKDLDYLSDMFQWNYGAFKKSHDCISKIEEEDIKSVIDSATTMFQHNLETILEILNEGGRHE